jgi:hypothetical protein
MQQFTILKPSAVICQEKKIVFWVSSILLLTQKNVQWIQNKDNKYIYKFCLISNFRLLCRPRDAMPRVSRVPYTRRVPNRPENLFSLSQWNYLQSGTFHLRLVVCNKLDNDILSIVEEVKMTFPRKSLKQRHRKEAIIQQGASSV